MGLDWMVVAVEASAFAAAPSAPSDRAWRLPTQTELVEAIANSAFTFGVAAAVWTDNGTRVDPTSETIVLEASDDSATAVFVFTTEKAFTRPPAPTKQRLTVLGYLDEATFQMCVEAAQHLNAEYKDEYVITVERMMGFEFERRRDAIAVTAGDSVKNLRVLVHNQDTGAVQSGDAFIERVTATTSFRTFDLPVTDPQSYQSLARVALRKHLASTGSTFVWLLVKIDDMVIGRIVFQLFSNICPKTCLNFQHLCRGDLPDIKVGNTVTKLSYKGSTFYRVVKNGWIQAGDIAGNKTGNGGMSIYGRHFPDESFDVAHDDAGTLGMANDGEHTNSSSFYITLKKSKWMDGRYVAFGRVVEGLHVVQAIHNSEVKPNQTPVKKITIDDCGDVSLDG